MKKYILMFGLTLVMGLFISNNVMAQAGNWEDNAANPAAWTTGKLGVGINAPATGFHLYNASSQADFRMESPAVSGAIGRFRIQSGNPGDPNGNVLNLALRYNATTGEAEMVQGAYSAFHGQWLQFNGFNLVTKKYLMSAGVGLAEFNNDGHFLINSSGSVGIGVPEADVAKLAGAKLAVNGKIVSTEVEVKLYGSWPDFVFQDDFNLMPLNELESFIATNRHLPGVPTEAEVTESGVNLGEMTGILLQKVEEMTLHIIELNKRIEELEK